MSIYIPPHVKIIVEDDLGEIKHSQSFSEYFHQPNINILSATYGPTLLDILVEESYISSTLQLNQILTGNPNADATRMIGSIAECLVVDICHKYPEANRLLGMHARFGSRASSKLDQYVAVATGSMRTKRLYGQHYNPSDTQRDVIWVEKENTQNQLLCISSNNSISAKPAGLQIKASHDGVRYVLPTIQNYHYPVLYFDLDGDWVKVREAMIAQNITCPLINPDSIYRELRHALQAYFNIVVAIIEGKTTIQQVITDSKYNMNSALGAGVDGSELTNNPQIILPSSVR
ncbi:hypothetical protein ABEG10_11780 [Burkholderia cenocepacia]|uniref:hypothetical protein n=1 Tax=Burkholderia cenocepacia TaxID=95486 RepID=UPI00209FC844|nr:hypothetical protein [Burkholderia cenocepacia]MCO8321129.1 hypothetical protein [Burkholderia cenocepacia]MCO8328611.1 hypothetical protein [Burkholderia cenocepacia]MCO8335897.1 hypothetical protein [Burkholderia cenocepacia]MCO8342984.1 hypothetical protein [Burkholderia cenocepacia]MCO8356266.1 hypothetical protein [Burkholderia cenocepacia]